MRLTSSLLVLALVASMSATAGARENHCDHSGGKTGGAIAGGIIGGVLGAALGHGKAGNIALGAGGGAIAGGIIGDDQDDERDFEECGTDAESFQREQDRNRARADEQAYRDARVDREIQYDRAEARRRRGPRYPRHPRTPYGPYQCQDLGRGYGLVHIPTNRIVQVWGYDLRGCQLAEIRANRGY